MRFLRTFLAAAVFFGPVAAAAAESPLIGTWKMQSYQREVVATGARSNALDEHPTGYISYAPDGRMYAIFGPGNRAKPSGLTVTEKEAAELHRTIVSYAGTYTIESDKKVVHHVDISWNQTFTGTEQVRFYVLKDDILTITTPPFPGTAGGQESRYILVWKKVK